MTILAKCCSLQGNESLKVFVFEQRCCFPGKANIDWLGGASVAAGGRVLALHLALGLLLVKTHIVAHPVLA